MKIVFDTKKNILKVGSKTFGVDMDKEKENSIILFLNKFIKDNTMLDDYDEDSMWMSYRYCIGRHTIAAHMRAGDIASRCYGRMSDERSIFTAFDINHEIENKMIFGCGPTWYFPITSLNRIYTSAIDIFCQFVEDYNITKRIQLLDYKDINIILADNERGYKFEVTTWEEYLRPQVQKIVQNWFAGQKIDEDYAWKYYLKWEKNPEDEKYFDKAFKEISKDRPNPEHFYLNDIEDLMVWNDLVHLFDIEHHHKSILQDGTEVEWYWTYIEDSEQHEDGYWYRKDIGYKRVRVPVTARIGSVKTWIPNNSIKKDIY